MRRSDGSLHFYVNGMDQGLAASGLPGGLFAVVDLYGKCAQVSICRPSSTAAENTLGQSHKKCIYTSDLRNNRVTALDPLDCKKSLCCILLAKLNFTSYRLLTLGINNPKEYLVAMWHKR